MRNLDLIQADIVFLLKQKERFFSRLFSFSPDRLNDLEAEEARAIDAMLLAENAEYKALAEANTDLLKNTHWSMKVTERTFRGRNLSYTGRLEGNIEVRGYAYAYRVADFSVLKRNPSSYTGKIDHLGKISVEAVDGGENSSLVPETLKCFTDAEAMLTMEKDRESSALTYDTHIKSLAGDPFNGNEHKRRQFLQNRQQLRKLIAGRQVKTSGRS